MRPTTIFALLAVAALLPTARADDPQPGAPRPPVAQAPPATHRILVELFTSQG